MPHAHTTAPRSSRQCHINDYRQLTAVERQLSEIIRVCAGLSSDFLRRHQINGDPDCLKAYEHYQSMLADLKAAHLKIRKGSKIQKRLWVNLQRTPSTIVQIVTQLKAWISRIKTRQPKPAPVTRKRRKAHLANSEYAQAFTMLSEPKELLEANQTKDNQAEITN